MPLRGGMNMTNRNASVRVNEQNDPVYPEQGKWIGSVRRERCGWVVIGLMAAGILRKTD
jgi:hypothetical protein